MTRASVLKYKFDLKNKNAKVGLRKKKEVVMGGLIYHTDQYAVIDVRPVTIANRKVGKSFFSDFPTSKYLLG